MGRRTGLIVKILEEVGEDYECLSANTSDFPNFKRYDGGIFERLYGDEWVVPYGMEKLLEQAYKEAGGKRA